jgi:hypothetical protein
MKLSDFLKYSILLLIVTIPVIAILLLILIHPNHIAHKTILEYLRIAISWPGVTLVFSFVVLFIALLLLKKKTKTEYIEMPKAEVTGFITIVGKTEDGSLIIKSNKKENIGDGNAVVNQAFIMDYFNNLQNIRLLKLELKKYQNKLLQK